MKCPVLRGQGLGLFRTSGFAVVGVCRRWCRVGFAPSPSSSAHPQRAALRVCPCRGFAPVVVPFCDGHLSPVANNPGRRQWFARSPPSTEKMKRPPPRRRGTGLPEHHQHARGYAPGVCPTNTGHVVTVTPATNGTHHHRQRGGSAPWGKPPPRSPARQQADTNRRSPATAPGGTPPRHTNGERHHQHRNPTTEGHPTNTGNATDAGKTCRVAPASWGSQRPDKGRPTRPKPSERRFRRTRRSPGQTPMPLGQATRQAPEARGGRRVKPTTNRRAPHTTHGAPPTPGKPGVSSTLPQRATAPTGTPKPDASERVFVFPAEPGSRHKGKGNLDDTPGKTRPGRAGLGKPRPPATARTGQTPGGTPPRETPKGQRAHTTARDTKQTETTTRENPDNRTHEHASTGHETDRNHGTGTPPATATTHNRNTTTHTKHHPPTRQTPTPKPPHHRNDTPHNPHHSCGKPPRQTP